MPLVFLVVVAIEVVHVSCRFSLFKIVFVAKNKCIPFRVLWQLTRLLETRQRLSLTLNDLANLSPAFFLFFAFSLASFR